MDDDRLKSASEDSQDGSLRHRTAKHVLSPSRLEAGGGSSSSAVVGVGGGGGGDGSSGSTRSSVGGGVEVGHGILSVYGRALPDDHHHNTKNSKNSNSSGGGGGGVGGGGHGGVAIGEEEEPEGYMGFSHPFSIDWIFGIIGSEYCHMYFWIAKDLSWTQGWRLYSISFGSFAIMWWFIILYHALRTKNGDEIWNAIALFLWLFANFWWMTGEAHDYAYPDSPAIAERHDFQSARMLEAALLLLVIYYFIVIPFELMVVDSKAVAEYDDGELKPRFSYFRNFRQYENVHMLFWLAKDLAWNLENISMWFVFLSPTFLVAADLLWMSWNNNYAIVDTAHYFSGLLWVTGNAVWALGEFFFEEYDEPILLWKHSKEALMTARWYSSWILFSAFWPIIILYAFWIPLSIMGKIPTPRPKSSAFTKGKLSRHSSLTSLSSRNSGGAIDLQGGSGDGGGGGNGGKYSNGGYQAETHEENLSLLSPSTMDEGAETESTPFFNILSSSNHSSSSSSGSISSSSSSSSSSSKEPNERSSLLSGSNNNSGSGTPSKSKEGRS